MTTEPILPTPSVRPPVIVSQMGEAIDHVLAGHWSRPIIRSLGPGEVPWDLADDVDVLLARPFGGWQQAPHDKPSTWPGSLKWVLTSSTGMDFFPRWITEGPPVSCGRGLNAVSIAEYVLGAMLRHAKRFETVRMRGPEDFRRVDLDGLDGKVLGLAGFGALGQAVAARAQAFGLSILALRRSRWSDKPEGIEPVGTIAELAARSDHLVVALPSTPETRHMINSAVLGQAKPGLHIVNVARGALIDQDALIAALDAGSIAAATLDVTDPEPLPAGHPLYSHPKVLVTPHLSWFAASNDLRMVAKILEQLDRYATGKPALDIVDPVTGY